MAIRPSIERVPVAPQALTSSAPAGIRDPNDSSRDLLAEALARAPMENEEIDADELRAIREGLDDRRAGRVVTTRELERELEI